MPCEPVTSGAPAAARTSSSPNSSTSSLAFRMKRSDSGGGGGGARRALTALGTNDTKLNLRLAKSLLTISQEKFAKKWNFDPVMEVPLTQGRFSWTPTIGSGDSPVVESISGLDLSSSWHLLGGLTSVSGSSSGPRGAAAAASMSHDLAATEAEDNAAALRTCLNLPGGLAPSSDNHRSAAALTPPTTGVLCHEDQRVPPIHPEELSPLLSLAEPSSMPAGDASRGPVTVGIEVGTTAKPCATPKRPGSPVDVASPISSSNSSSDSSSPIRSDASEGPPSSVDSEVSTEAPQDNQCLKIDPKITTSSLTASTDELKHQTSGAQTQTCITNYLHPRKRSSAHLKESVHPSKAKKVMLAA